MVVLCRMQVTTSCKTRRPGTWNSTSLVADSDVELRRHLGNFMQTQMVARGGGAKLARKRPDRRKCHAAECSCMRKRPLARSGTSIAIRPSAQSARSSQFRLHLPLPARPLPRLACGRAGRRQTGQLDRSESRCHRSIGGGSPRSTGRQWSSQLHGRARCPPACCGR